MKIPLKTLSTGFSLPILGLGTWRMGGKREKNTIDDEKNITIIQEAIHFGVTHIDTAEAYGEGHSEELIGLAIKEFDRKNLFLTSKISPEHALYADVMISLKESLRRLQTSYLDLYLLHRPNPIDIPIADTMHALDDLVAEGLVKNIGVSNFNNEQFEEAQFYAKNKLVVNQVHYNLLYREAEKKALVEYCIDNDVMLVAYRPLQEGLLANNGIQILDELCSRYHKTPIQIALNWLISQSNIVTIAQTSNKQHLEEMIGAVDFFLSPEDIEKLRREFPDQKNISNVAPLSG